MKLLISVFILQCVLISALYEDELFHKVYGALDRVLDFIYENRKSMNVDGLFGVALAKAQLQNILDKHGNLKSNSGFQTLNEKAQTILDSVDISHMDLNRNYKLFSEYLLEPNIWMKHHKGSSPNDLIIMKPILITCAEYSTALENSHFSEKTSDFCIAELIESTTTNVLNISEQCNRNMLENNPHENGIGYNILHRLLYLQVGKALQKNWNTTLLNQNIQKFCSNIYVEAQLAFRCDHVFDLDDLFLEQVLLCGMEGFEQFLKRQWISHVLSLQTASGCYGRALNRRKREANTIKDGCVDHTTGLAAGVLSLTLKSLVH